MKKHKASRFDNKYLIENREVRFFLSSTFQDMDEERNAIVKVFNELKIEANKRNVILTMVDLRWGVTEEEAKTGKVLSICLSEIEHSHPFFIGLLGSRYGSSPNLKELENNNELEERYPWIRKDIENELSITEIEIRYGVLRNPSEVDAAFFIRKTPNNIPDDNERLTKLKEDVRDKEGVTSDDYNSIEDLCQKVRVRVINIMDKYFGVSDNTILAKERMAQLAYINTYHAHYIKNNINHKVVDDFIHGERQYLVIYGPSGIGKSAMIANWIKENIDTLPYQMIYYFLGNSTMSNNYRTILSYIRDNIYDYYQIDRDNYSNESLEKETQRILIEATEKGMPLLIIIDGINQIVEHDNAKLLNWLPTAPNNKVKFLFTTITDDETWETFIRRDYHRCEIKPLTKSQRKRFSKQYLSYVGKKLEDNQIERIISDKECKNTLVLKTLLDELICFGSHKKLKKRISYYLSASSKHDFFNRMLKRMETDYSLDQDIVRHTLLLIALSEEGLSEEEILSITGIRQIDWYCFYSAFYNHFITKQGLILFSHQYISDTVRKRYKLEKSNAQSPYRKEIANFFASPTVNVSSKSRQISELAFQYFNLRDCEHLYKTILSFDAFNHYCNTNLNPLAEYWRMLLATNHKRYSLDGYLYLSCKEIKAQEMPLLNVGLFASLYFADYQFSIKCYQVNIQKTINELGPNHPHIAAAYNNIGDEYANLSNSKHAIENYEKALTIAESTLGANNPDTANVYNNIGTVMADMGDYQKALEYHHKALNVHLNKLGEKHPSVAVDYNNIGMVYYEQGYYEQAKCFYEKAISISEALQGTEYPDTALYISNLGDVFLQIGDYEKAKEKYGKALAIRYVIFGKIHPEIATSYNNIGFLYYDQDKLEMAMKFFSAAKVISEQTQGKEHPDTAAAYNNMGLVFHSCQNYKTAYNYYSLALAIRKEKLGENHPETAFTYNNIGVLYYNQGEYAEALNYFFKALSIRENVLGFAHPDTAHTYQYIGDVYFDQKNCHKSLRYYLKALAIRKRVLGVDHQDTGLSYAKIGAIYDHAEKYVVALKYYSKSLVALEKNNHPQANEIRERVELIKKSLGL
jgi:tetratricopeptide (TPR) repeat protein